MLTAEMWIPSSSLGCEKSEVIAANVPKNAVGSYYIFAVLLLLPWRQKNSLKHHLKGSDEAGPTSY